METEGRTTGGTTAAQEEPAVSIVVPVHNDEEWVGRAIASCLAQTWADVEVVCVDDASIDDTCGVVERLAAEDSRIRLIRQESNRSAFQARRVGVMEAAAPFVLFLDGDDELAPDAAGVALRQAREQQADVVGFGVELITDGGAVPRRFEADLQPRHPELHGDEILPALFPAERIAQGHLWRYLWSTDLLRAAYRALPADLQLRRANDIPITMLALGHARRYVSTTERLYRYFFRRGVSGRAVVDRDAFSFYLTGLDSIDAIADAMRAIADRAADPAQIHRSCASARLSAIQVILRYAVTVEDEEDQAECLRMLCDKAGAADVVRAAATFFSDALSFLARHREVLSAPRATEARTVLLFTGNLGSGGVQGVLVSQAEHLLAAGYRVVVALRTLRGRVHELPDEVELVEVEGQSLGEKLDSIHRICREHAVDHVLDHYILYNDDWPYFALMTRTLGVRTIGWIHNFALRPMFDFNHRAAYLRRHLPLLEKVVTLSATDVAFWRSQGIEHAVYLPNPPSPWLLERPLRTEPKELSEGPIRLVWWGRIQQHTKRVRELIDVAAALRQLGVEFRLSIIGPDSEDLTAEELREEAVSRGLDDAVLLPGPMYGDELLAELSTADVYVCTSAIEGYPLTLIEAQALGLPVAMYELPWLAVAEDNGGLITSEQEDSWGLARRIAALHRDPEGYAARSRASLEAAARALTHDFTELYSQLLSDTLPAEHSPERTLERADLLIDRAVDFHQQNVGRQGLDSRGSSRTPGGRAAVEKLKATVLEHRSEARRLKTAVLDLRQKIRTARVENRRLKRRVEELQAALDGERRRSSELQASVRGRSTTVVLRALRNRLPGG